MIIGRAQRTASMSTEHQIIGLGISSLYGQPEDPKDRRSRGGGLKHSKYREEKMERVKRIELSTSTLARLRSTPELHPPGR